MKSEPFSIRLSRPLNDLIVAEAARTRTTKGALIEELADEALRCRRFPGIAFRDRPPWRRAWVVGTSLDVWEIIEALGNFDSVDKLAVEGTLTDRQIRLAEAYYRAYPDEIDLALAENRRSIEELRELYPTIGAQRT